MKISRKILRNANDKLVTLKTEDSDNSRQISKEDFEECTKQWLADLTLWLRGSSDY